MFLNACCGPEVTWKATIAPVILATKIFERFTYLCGTPVIGRVMGRTQESKCVEMMFLFQRLCDLVNTRTAGSLISNLPLSADTDAHFPTFQTLRLVRLPAVPQAHAVPYNALVPCQNKLLLVNLSLLIHLNASRRTAISPVDSDYKRPSLQGRRDFLLNHLLVISSDLVSQQSCDYLPRVLALGKFIVLQPGTYLSGLKLHASVATRRVPALDAHRAEHRHIDTKRRLK